MTGTRGGRRTGRAGDGRAAVVALAIALATSIVACAAPGVTPNPPGATGAPAPGLMLEVRDVPGYGAIVVGEDGRSLYVFTKDGPGTSACSGDCASSWPPLIVTGGAGATGGSGVNAAVGTITRSDGASQVTLGGAPLYYFAADARAGDTSGQGIGGVWFLASPSGGPVGGAAATPAAGAASPTPCVGRSCY